MKPALFVAAAVAAVSLSAQIEVVSDGKVGIGTTSPAYKLSVTGDVKITSATQSKLLFSNQESAVFASLEYDDTNGSFNLVNPRAYPLRFFTDNTERLRVAADGKVGIGTTSVATPLHVVGHASREVARFQGSTDVTDNRNFISLYSTNPGYWWELSNQDTVGGGTLNGLAFRERSGGGASAPRVYFASGGNVGIGTMSATTRLHVSGGAIFNQMPSGPANYIFGNADGGTNAKYSYLAGASGGNVMFGKMSDDLSTKTEFMRIDGSNGNVGIGTGSPGSKLHVSGGTIQVTSTTSTNGFMAIEPGGSGYAGYIGWYRNGPTRLGYMGYQDLAGSPNNLGLNLENSANFIIGGGNVGIGTASPVQKLHVNGTVRATSFISDTGSGGYADFVFKPSYRLASLSEVEAHIQEHGHLPDVPSEAQVAKEGIDLAAMQVKLLQKVEELTLHAIAQQKEIEALKRQLAEQIR